jgi:hypothetical protein
MKQNIHTGVRFSFICLLLVSTHLINNLVNASEEGSDKRANENRITIAPPADFYPRYLADPRSAQTAITFLGIFNSDIEDAGAARFNFSLGNRFGVVRFGDEPTYKAWQLDLEIGFFSHFDLEDSLDNIGWDGIFGLYFSRRLSAAKFIRFGFLHDSSHLGDEFVEETGRQRIDYTRQELIAGMTWLPAPRSKLYTELGWAYDLKGNQEALRWQWGAEYFGAHNDHYLGLPWYAATDITFFQERDWEPAINLQMGLIYATDRATERYRFVIEAYRGRSVIGEFSFENESYLSIGVHYDY